MNIELLRSECVALPYTREDIKWENDLCFTIAEKIYCVGSLVEPFCVSLKVTEDQFHIFTNMDGIKPAPYLARYFWVCIVDVSVFNKNEWRQYITQSYQLIKEKLSKKTLLKLYGTL